MAHLVNLWNSTRTTWPVGYVLLTTVTHPVGPTGTHSVGPKKGNLHDDVMLVSTLLYYAYDSVFGGLKLPKGVKRNIQPSATFSNETSIFIRDFQTGRYGKVDGIISAVPSHLTFETAVRDYAIANLFEFLLRHWRAAGGAAALVEFLAKKPFLSHLGSRIEQGPGPAPGAAPGLEVVRAAP